MKKKVIIILIVLVVFVGALGYAYSKWFASEEQITKNVFRTNCLDTTIVEGEAINLQNVYPITDSEGKALTPYTFSIKNTCGNDQKIQINLELFATNASFDAGQIRYIFNDSTPDYVNSMNEMNPILNNATGGYILTTDTLQAGSTHEYNLKMWIDENETVETASNKIFKTRISVISSYGK